MKGDAIRRLVVSLLLLGVMTAAAASLQRITIADKVSFRVEVVSTPEERARGLGYRDSLPLDQGMLFLFEEPDYHTFWMRGMRFPLDILWIREGVIVHIEENLPPPSPLYVRLPTYRPAEKADSVLEINAGLVQKYGLQVGDTVVYR